MKEIIPSDLKTADLHAYLLGAIAPRPIAFVSTMDAQGNINLSPFSFFNVFGTRPPVLIFSPALRGRDAGRKHSLDNIIETGTCVVNIVDYAMVQQMSLASSEYPKGVNEFIKSGLSMLESVSVKPPRVAESPVQFECKLMQVLATGDQGGAGQLVICEVVRIHIRESILDEQGRIDPYKIDQVARLGGDWYTRAAEGLFRIAKPLSTPGIGVDALPEAARQSSVLTGNELGMLGNIEPYPDEEELISFSSAADIQRLMESYPPSDIHNREQIHHAVAERLKQNEYRQALMLLLLWEGRAAKKDK